MKVLGIETSCDETAAAIYDSQQGLLSHELYTQVEMHKAYGGVVPELASRDHIRKILPVCQAALTKANCELKDLTGIAYTKGPGLIGALMVGASFARTLGYALNIPTIGIHHLEAHLLAPLLETPAPLFPFLALLVSGGHSQIIAVDDIGKYKILGESIDDAAGEAFDKTAKLLGLPYPGGAHLAKLAENGNPKRFHFPRPMVDRPGLDLSFSGLKTHVLQVTKAHELDDQTKADIAYAFQDAVVDTLLIKIKRAIDQTNLSRLVVAGGVGANLVLRRKLTHYMHEIKGEIFFPRLEFCTDNAAMVALTGWHRLQRGEKDSLAIDVVARWDLEEV